MPPFSWGRSLAAAVVLLTLGGCGGGSGPSTPTPPPPPTFTLGGTVTGLTGTGLVLQNNGGDTLSITTNGPFTFSSALNAGAAYAVTVLTQPINPPQNCTVASGSGTVAGSNVTAVAVTCAAVVFKLTTGKLASTRMLHTATLLADGRVLITGGLVNSVLDAVDTAELYDPAANTSTMLSARMTSLRNQHTATLLPNGKVLIAGGSSHGDGDAMSTAELYDPATQAFAALSATMRSPRGWHTATLLPDGQVLFVSGFNDGPPVTTAELYDPIANTFSMAADAATDRQGHAATLLPDGTVLIAGGATADAFGTTAELYDPASQSFAPLGASLNEVRGGHTMTLLASGQVLVAGGTTLVGGATVNSLNSAEIYDPATNTFSPLAATMATPRVGHTATLLPNGTVLILGGGTGANTPVVVLDTVEVYEP